MCGRLILPTSLHRNLRELAQREGVSVDQIIDAAAGEKAAVLHTLDYLRERAKRGSRATFDAVLTKIPDAEPPGYDQPPHALAAGKGASAGRTKAVHPWALSRLKRIASACRPNCLANRPGM